MNAQGILHNRSDDVDAWLKKEHGKSVSLGMQRCDAVRVVVVRSVQRQRQF